MTNLLDHQLQQYGELSVRVGLNLEAGQRLLIIGPLASGGVSLEAAALVRHVASSAYRAGARLVETIWGDEQLLMIRFREAPAESFDEYSTWLPKALAEHMESGGAVLSIYANDPDQMKDQSPERITSLQRATARSVQAFRELVSRNRSNWTVIGAAAPGWAARVFPNLAPDQQMSSLWETIARLCRLDRTDPVSAWNTHLAALAARRDMLNAKRYEALRYRGPGTDLTVGLAPGHVWVSGQSETPSGISFAPNLPTEEVFTMPHKDRVDGVVRSSRPLSYGGTLIEGFTLRFAGGRVVDVAADRGGSVLRELVETDEGSGRIGEIALVADSSPVSQSGLLFYNTLYDENAASHVALGSAYTFTVAGGEGMTTDEFERAGGNRSVVHVDFMIGSAELDVDGVLGDGTAEPLMRHGEWA